MRGRDVVRRVRVAVIIIASVLRSDKPVLVTMSAAEWKELERLFPGTHNVNADYHDEGGGNDVEGGVNLQEENR